MAPNMQLAEGLSLTLSHASPSSPWTAIDVVVTRVDHRHRITFAEEQPFDQVFCREIVDLLAPILGGFADRNAVYTNPDVEISVPGLSLGRLRVIYSTHGASPSRVLVRFAAYAGNPHRLLLADAGFTHPMDSLASKVYRDALDWVLIPAINILMVDETDGFGKEDQAELHDALARLRTAKNQLLFQVEMVKRELGRLERHDYTTPRLVLPQVVAEPPQEDFHTLRIIQDMD